MDAGALFRREARPDWPPRSGRAETAPCGICPSPPGLGAMAALFVEGYHACRADDVSAR